MKKYYRVILGRANCYVPECLKNNFIGTSYNLPINLSNELSANWRDFNLKFIPEYLKNNPGKSKITAGLACGAIWTVSKGMSEGDVVLCPNGEGEYLVGEVIGSYSYAPEQILPHRRQIRWFNDKIKKLDMSVPLRNSTGSIGVVSAITKHSDEIERLIKGIRTPVLISTDETVEDPSVFALEEHLEEFLIANWDQTDLGRKYDIYQEDGELVGQQYVTDTGPIDILAISKDKKELLVIELKKGRASDTVVGQIQRYMGYVKEELLEDHQVVRGVIIAHTEHLGLKRALSVTRDIEFYQYQVNFRLKKTA